MTAQLTETNPTETNATETNATETNATEELAGRLFTAGVGALELGCAYLGVRLRLYRALAEHGPQSAAELASRTGLNERYAREWLQAQAISSLVTIDGDDVATGTFTLADGVVDVFVDETSPAYLGGLPTIFAALGGVLPQLADAYRTGAPVSYAAYGPDAVIGQAALNRPAFANSLVGDWLPQMPDVLARLGDTAHPATVGDFGCGAGWAAIELAKALPHVHIDALDNDESSIAAGRNHAVDNQVADRVNLEVRDLSDESAGWAPRYDVVFFFECLHDLPRPVEALRNARAALRPGGSVVVMDERADPELTTPGDDVQRFLATASALWCLPQGLVGPDPEPVGTMLRPAMMQSLAERAGYAGVEVLPIEHPFWRFYRLQPATSS